MIQDRIVDGRGAVTPDPFDEAKAGRTARAKEPGGLAGWVIGMIHRRSGKAAERHLQVIETLALGGRRQLLLVTCDGERFLIGSGADRVETIVRVDASKATGDSWA